MQKFALYEEGMEKVAKEKMTQEEKVNYMTTKDVQPLICELAVPTIISMLVTAFYNMVDTFFVGKINTQSTAAVGIVFTVMALIQACGFFFGHGTGNYISRKLGEREYESAAIMASTGFFLAFLFGVGFAAVGLLFLDPLAIMLGSTDTILPYTRDYMRIILIGTPFMISSFVLNNQLRFQGSASYAMVGIVVGAVVNIVLDPLLIFGCKMGVAGAALATVLSQMISFIILYMVSLRGGNIRIQMKNFKPSFSNIYEIARGGFPSLCRQGLASVAGIFLNHMAGTFGGASGDAAIAAMSIVNRVTMFANSALIGFGQGFQPVCGMNYGAKKYERVKEGFWFCVKYAFIFLLVVAALGFIFAEPLISVFRKDDAEVIRIGTVALRFQCIAFPLNAWIVMCNMMLQSIGRAVKASVVASSRQGLFFIPFIFILPNLFGLLGVQMCQMAADIGSFVFSLPIGLKELKIMKSDKNDCS